MRHSHVPQLCFIRLQTSTHMRCIQRVQRSQTNVECWARNNCVLVSKVGARRARNRSCGIAIVHVSWELCIGGFKISFCLWLRMVWVHFVYDVYIYIYTQCTHANHQHGPRMYGPWDANHKNQQDGSRILKMASGCTILSVRQTLRSKTPLAKSRSDLSLRHACIEMSASWATSRRRGIREDIGYQRLIPTILIQSI